MKDEYDRLADILDSEGESSSAFAEALEQMERLAERGNVEAAEAVAEVFAFSDQHRNVEKAYVWYHVALANQGYSTLFRNELAPPHYAGVVGDFRNEAQVNDLVTALGFTRAQELDIVAQEWIRRHQAV